MGVSGYATNHGGLAHLVEHLLCKQGVNGSIPLTSTRVVNRVFKVIITFEYKVKYFGTKIFNKMDRVRYNIKFTQRIRASILCK